MSPTTRVSSADLTRLDAGRLAAGIARGDFSAVEVTRAHLAHIDAINPRLNALVAETRDRALSDAAAVDRQRQLGQPLGPLAGVPVTIKECFHVAGTAATLGIEQFSAEIHSEFDEGPLVQQFRRCGAVILGKSNVPQLMLLQETDNPLYGITRHPDAPERSPGGSSGGEAALLAAGCSALGLGSDMGGSIRQPAHSCGIHGIKPTNGRLSMAGSRRNFNGMNAIGIQPGPMARSVDDLELALATFVAAPAGRSEPALPPVAWSSPDQVNLSKLRVACYVDDGNFTPSPAIRRAVGEAASALRSQGVTVEMVSPPDGRRAVELFVGLTSSDGGADARRMLAGAAVQSQLARLLRIARLPVPAVVALGWLLNRIGQRGLAQLVSPVRKSSAARYLELAHAASQFAGQFIARLDAGNYDAVLLPPHGLPALRHGTFVHLLSSASYCLVPNLVGMPCGVVAATRVRPDEESDRQPGGDYVQQLAARVERGSAGLPVGVQLMARHWREDVLLALMRATESHFCRQDDYPVRR